jgi:hypothetical protein
VSLSAIGARRRAVRKAEGVGDALKMRLPIAFALRLLKDKSTDVEDER